MKKWKSLIKNSNAIAVIYDTILFLTFISIAGAILLPAFIPSNISSTSEQNIHDTTADEALHLMIISTCEEFNYSIAQSLIQPFADQFGINTSHTNGLYQSLIQWVLGKQQYHKTIGEHIAELLFCKMEFPISLNESIHLNVLTTDYETQLKNQITLYLDRQLKDSYHYHLAATWKPIKNLKFGGTFALGEPIPKTNQYVAYQKISMPFLPILTAQEDIIVLSEEWITEKIEQYTNDILLCKNIAKISKILNDSNLTNDEKEDFYTFQDENISSLILNIIFDGLYDANNTRLIPGILFLILTNYMNDFSQIIYDNTSHYIANSTGYAFSNLNTFFMNCDDTMNQYFTSYITDIINSIVVSSFSNITTEITELSEFLIQVILSTLKEQIKPFINSFFLSLSSSIQTKRDYANIIHEVISMIFSQLSLTQASITLTIWEGHTL